jgi:hypothetical protein
VQFPPASDVLNETRGFIRFGIESSSSYLFDAELTLPVYRSFGPSLSERQAQARAFGRLDPARPNAGAGCSASYQSHCLPRSLI